MGGSSFASFLVQFKAPRRGSDHSWFGLPDNIERYSMVAGVTDANRLPAWQATVRVLPWRASVVLMALPS